MKKISVILFVLLTMLLYGCSSSDPDALRFREEYEKLNGEETGSGNTYREIEIDENNPFRYVSLKQILDRMDNGESFIIYFGANWCPWCRSILPTVIDVAKKLSVKEICYVDVRPDNDTSLDIRDEYETDGNGEVFLAHEGTQEYHAFVRRAADVLADYAHGNVESLDGTPFAGAKTVGAPNFVVIVKGKAVTMITGISSLQKDPYQDLNDDILTDVNDMFTKLFKDYLNSR